MQFAVLTDDEFLAMVADRGQPDEMNHALLAMRRDGAIQILDDGTGDPLIIKAEQMN